MHRVTTINWFVGACAALVLAGCGGDGTPVADISGTVSGLAAGASVGLEDSNATILSVSGSSAFAFPDTLAANTPYAVTVATQPAGATCSVANASGTTDGNADPVNNVLVSCVPGTTLGGTVSGLVAGASVTLTDGNTVLPVSVSGNYVFSDLYANAASYTVSVATQPSGALCTVMNGSGAIDANGDAVNNIAVTCAAVPALGGTVVGLAPNASVTLGDGSSQQTVAANGSGSGSGSFGFADSFAPGASYMVSVITQPAGQTCSVANGTGTVDGADDPVNNVTVTCTTTGAVGGSVTGLAANATLVLNDGNATLALSANGSFAFPDLYAPGAVYAVSVQGQPIGQTCAVVTGTGTGVVDTSDDAVTSVSITCG